MAKSSPLLVALCLLGVTAAWANSPALNIEKALEAQYELLSERPGDSTVHNDLGNLLSLVDRVDEAEVAYLRAKELDPLNPSTRFNLGLLFQQSGRLEDANEEYYALLEIQPDNAWAHYQLGSVAYSQGKVKTAKELYARSFAIDPTLSFPRHNPHIIDNPLATEALLLSSRYLDGSTARVPRRYAEASRIADIMLEEERLAMPDSDPTTTAQPSGEPEGGIVGGTSFHQGVRQGARFEDDEAEIGNRVLTNEDLENVGQAGQAGNRNPRRGADRSRRGASRFSTAGRARAAQPKTRNNTQRSLSENDPRANARGRQVQPGRVNGGLTVGQALQERQGGTPETNQPTTRRRTPAAGAGSVLPESQTRRYRPGRRSTASLSLKMLDEQAG